MSLLVDDKTHQDPQAQIGGDHRIPDQSRAARTRSFDVDAFGVPTGREEEWRFTPVDRLGGVFSDTATDDRDGDPAAELTVRTPEGVSTATLSPGQAPRGTVLVPEDRGAAVASANTAEALHVMVAAEAELTEPARIDVTGQGAGRRSNGHVVLEAGRHSTALVILDHTGAADHTGNLEVLVGDGANLTVVSLQRWDDEALHLAQHEALVGRDATYKHIAVSIGGGIVRMNSNVRYAGPGGDATLLGVYFSDAGQHLEHRSFVDHNAPRCTSLVTYKGALQGETARTVWVGDVLIRAEAEGIDTYELNRNLVLTDGARADSVPNLEIETGDIEGAGHASSTGRFDDEQLFYLMSRGISEDQARRLVVRGFFADIIAKIGVPEVVETLMEAIEEELSLTMGSQPAPESGTGAA
ncbi:Fe-S cluster assembly protein SufD [Serinicoccus sp. CNJ-927]|uniref:Fe-S cluster assembly protein SufD n=1 Tax=unclassified Serinicoccus TaxID=2643101 RepID=UPI0009623E01|nr:MULTISPECIES: Fe-S cluster assembly protein SufD [unclassified Serinicoccus]OLT15865.1 Fe-S cluster assembly protein SufD [Serinicoccus sp. CUA-874]OLT44047.1 Fe-S cluster assembly protein SufD [Serinicoccus sp. CNJ-927]